MVEEQIKVLIVDDTIVYRKILSDTINSIPRATVVGTAPNGKLALKKLESLHVDLVLLDVEMPVMNGLETLGAINSQYPDIGVIMVSGVNKNSASITLKALNKGAIDFIPKPEGKAPDESRALLREQLKRLLVMFTTRRNLQRAKAGGSPEQRTESVYKKSSVDFVATPIKPKTPAPSGRMAPVPNRIDIVAIGVSTGGPNALAAVIPDLPGDLGVPVLLVQHMPPLFTASLADSLNKKSQLKVCEASDNDPIEPNKVLIAPGGKHMVVRSMGKESGDRNHCIHINENPPEHSCRPSVDVLFRSIAANYNGNILAVVLTGMGNDGCEGVRTMKRRGCFCLIQDEETCVVYGMPQAVYNANLSDESLPLSRIASRITGLIKK